MRSPKRTNRKYEEPYLINNKIEAKNVRCIDQENNNIGVISFTEALRIAQQAELDLVQISSNAGTPVCRVVDYSKFKYEKSKQEKIAKKKQRENIVKVKELKLRPSTSDNDIAIKAKQAVGFFAEGNKVKITIVFKGREMNHKDVGMNALNRFLKQVPEAQLESDPVQSGKILTAILNKKPDVAEEASL